MYISDRDCIIDFQLLGPVAKTVMNIYMRPATAPDNCCITIDIFCVVGTEETSWGSLKALYE